MSGVKVIKWLEPNICLYASDEYFDPKQLEDSQMKVNDSAGNWHQVIKVEKADEFATEEWPHVYRMTVKTRES